MTWNTVLLKLVLVSQLIWTTHCQQLHQLKYVAAGRNPNVITPQYSSMTPVAQLQNAQTRFMTAASVCTYGMWALYNVLNWGEGIDDPAQVQVISIRSPDITACTKSSDISLALLANVKSLNFLGNPNPSMDGISIYTEPTFIGGRWVVTTFPAAFPQGMTGYRMGSFAITGTTMGVQICGDTDCTDPVCVDMTMQPRGLFIVSNALTDTTTKWPRVVRAINLVPAAMCSQFRGPPPPLTLRSEIIGGLNSTILVVES